MSEMGLPEAFSRWERQFKEEDISDEYANTEYANDEYTYEETEGEHEHSPIVVWHTDALEAYTQAISWHDPARPSTHHWWAPIENRVTPGLQEAPARWIPLTSSTGLYELGMRNDFRRRVKLLKAIATTKYSSLTHDEVDTSIEPAEVLEKLRERSRVDITWRLTIDVQYVCQRLRYAMTGGQARIWLVSPNASLRGGTPIDGLALGQTGDVISAIDMEEQGAYS